MFTCLQKKSKGHIQGGFTSVAWGISYISIALISIVLSIYAFNKKDISGFRYFAAFALLQAIWCFCYGLEIVLPSYAAKILVAKVQYVSIVVVPIVWLVFSLSYTNFDKWISLRKFLLLSVIPSITIVLVATNEFHGFIWSKIDFVTTGLGVELLSVSYAMWFWIQMAYSYLLFAIAFIHLSLSLFFNPAHQRRAILFLAFCSTIPFFFKAFYLFGNQRYLDLSPIGFFVSTILIMWGLFFNSSYSISSHSSTHSITSTAREAVLELMQDAVVVIGEKDNIVDLNQRAVYMFKDFKAQDFKAEPRVKEGFVGKHIDKLFPLSTKLLPVTQEGFEQTIASESIGFNSEYGAGEFAQIHVELQNKIRYHLKEQLSKTDEGIEVLKQFPEKVKCEGGDAYSIELARANRHFNIRVSNFSTASRQRGRVLVIQDISAQREQNKLIEEMIFFDKLTNLYNRYSFMQYAKLLLEEGVPLSLLTLDLDRFKQVNDLLGHNLADDLLIQVSKRLLNVVTDSDTVARLGADEFAILISGNDLTKAKQLAEDILIAFRSPFSLQGHILHTHLSIGIVTSNSTSDVRGEKVDKLDIGELMRHADIAMYEAKHQALGFSIYSSQKTVKTLRNLNLENDLIQAIEKSEFKLFYQPIVQAHNCSLVGFEALLRWKKGDSYVGPAQFISFAEEVGVMKLIDYWVLEKVMSTEKEQLPDGFVALNISGTTLRDDGLVQHAKMLINQGYSSEGIILEVTESAMMNVSIATSVLQELKSLGFQIAIDDFGTGYSSLSYIEQFPLDILKIDRSFISGIGKSAVSEALLRTIISLGQNLGVVVLGEGVETAEQRDWLANSDCLYLQGHLYGWPQPVEHYSDETSDIASDETTDKASDETSDIVSEDLAAKLQLPEKNLYQANAEPL